MIVLYMPSCFESFVGFFSFLTLKKISLYAYNILDIIQKINFQTNAHLVIHKTQNSYKKSTMVCMVDYKIELMSLIKISVI